MSISKPNHGSGIPKEFEDVPEEGFILHFFHVSTKTIRPEDVGPDAYWLYQIIKERTPSGIEHLFMYAHTCMNAEDAHSAFYDLVAEGYVVNNWQRFVGPRES